MINNIKAIGQAIVIIIKCVIGSRGKPVIFRLLLLQEMAKIKQQIRKIQEENRITKLKIGIVLKQNNNELYQYLKDWQQKSIFPREEE